MLIESHSTSLYAEVQHGVLFMDGYFTTHNECAALITAPRTIFESQHMDKYEIVAACASQDGCK